MATIITLLLESGLIPTAQYFYELSKEDQDYLIGIITTEDIDF